MYFILIHTKVALQKLIENYLVEYLDLISFKSGILYYCILVLLIFIVVGPKIDIVDLHNFVGYEKLEWIVNCDIVLLLRGVLKRFSLNPLKLD
jgi:hypothetical protein